MSPCYDYKCKQCGQIFEEYHGVHEIVTECVKCGGEVFKTFEGLNIGFINDFHESYWDNGLGCRINSKQQRAALMKEKGLTEVGNEKKYVMPQYGRKLKEEKAAKAEEELKGQAMYMLSNMEG